MTSSLNINVLKDEILQNYYDLRDTTIFEILMKYQEAMHNYDSVTRARLIPDSFHKYKIEQRVGRLGRAGVYGHVNVYERMRSIPISDNIFVFLCQLLYEDLKIILDSYFIPELNKIIVEYSIYN